MDIPRDPNVIAGIDGSEDAGVYKLDETTAIVQTIDIITPIVDDPRIFGRVAAANSLSDVYAMGGRPITAMNVVCFPTKSVGMDPLKEILQGGLEILKEAGVALVGGHSVDDNEPKYGLSVTGLVHPDRIMFNSGLRPDDRIILTKAIGTGMLATALKGGLASDSAVDAMVASMCFLNAKASEVAVSFGLRACTDVTGFGLGGHLVEMARASSCAIRIHSTAIPLLEGAFEAASMGLVPGGARSNRDFFKSWTTIAPGVTSVTVDLVFDPQTSGGLLLGVPGDRADAFLKALKAEGVAMATEIGEVFGAHPDGLLEIE